MQILSHLFDGHFGITTCESMICNERYVCVYVCVCVCMRVCVCVCVYACMRASVRVFERERICWSTCVYMRYIHQNMELHTSEHHMLVHVYYTH